MGKKYLQTNGKLKNSTIMSYAFNLPAIETCPNASVCVKFCFAAIEQNMYKQAMGHRQDSLKLTRGAEFISVISNELLTLRERHSKSNTRFAIRIHASGDFYSAKYMHEWNEIAHRNPDIQFYAYTKSVALAKKLQDKAENLTLIYSMGGQLDKLINIETDRHARIFRDENELVQAGYVQASEDDTVAWSNTNTKIGLVVFGARKSSFNEVA